MGGDFNANLNHNSYFKEMYTVDDLQYSRQEARMGNIERRNIDFIITSFDLKEIREEVALSDHMSKSAIIDVDIKRPFSSFLSKIALKK